MNPARKSGKQINRMVIGLCAGGGGGGMAAAAHIAAAMGLDIEGLFIEDEDLFGLAALPFVTELQSGTLTARPVDRTRLEHEMRAAASALQRALAAAAQPARASWRFASVRGHIESVVATATAPGDVVAVLEPAGPFSQAAHAAVKLRRAAMRSPASVLYIPEAARWRPGAVVAVLDGGSESHSEVLGKAVAIAAASRQQLVVLEAISGSAGKAGLSSLLEAYALGPAHLLVRGLEADSPEALEHALHPIAQSLIILARGALGLDEEGELMRLAARHQVPVLALEPKAG